MTIVWYAATIVWYVPLYGTSTIQDLLTRNANSRFHSHSMVIGREVEGFCSSRLGVRGVETPVTMGQTLLVLKTQTVINA